jgi:hypothetical protein
MLSTAGKFGVSFLRWMGLGGMGGNGMVTVRDIALFSYSKKYKYHIIFFFDLI